MMIVMKHDFSFFAFVWFSENTNIKIQCLEFSNGLFWYLWLFIYLQYVQTDSPTCKTLAALVVQLLQFQEDAFGRRVSNPALTKLPVSLHLQCLRFLFFTFQIYNTSAHLQNITEFNIQSS